MFYRHLLCFLAVSIGTTFAVGCSSGGLPDASTDAGTPKDAGFADSSITDGGSLDATHRDAQAPDAGEPAGDDASAVDADEPDASGPDAGPANNPAISLDFEVSVPPSMSVGTATLTPSQGFAPLGTAGNTFGPTFLRSLTGNAITLTLSALPAHTAISIDFLFAAIDSLDGEGSFPAGDYFRIDLDGTTIFREAFANAVPSQVQTYEPPVPEIVLARHVDLGFSGPGGFYTDSAYDMSLDPTFDRIPHTSSTAVILFTLEGTGVQSLDDESWAIDNLRVTLE